MEHKTEYQALYYFCPFLRTFFPRVNTDQFINKPQILQAIAR